jgi:hypothetical protein
VEIIELNDIKSENINCENEGCLLNSDSSYEIIINSSIFNGFVSTENGGILSITDPLIIKILNCSFINSIANLNGGAIFINNLNRDYILFELEISIF